LISADRAVEYRDHLLRAMIIGVLRQNSGASSLTDAPCLGWRQTRQDIGYGFAIFGQEDFPSWLEEQVDPAPFVADDAGAGSGCLEDTSRRREAEPRHALAIDIEGRQSRAIEGIEEAAPHVSGDSDVARKWLAL